MACTNLGWKPVRILAESLSPLVTTGTYVCTFPPCQQLLDPDVTPLPPFDRWLGAFFLRVLLVLPLRTLLLGAGSHLPWGGVSL